MKQIDKIMRLIVIDQHPIVREGIRHILKDQANIRIAAEFGSIQEAMKANPPISGSLIWLDDPDPGGNTMDFQWVRLGLPTVIVCAEPNKAKVVALKSLGARGLILKDSVPSVYLEALRQVKVGNRFFSPEIVHFLNEAGLPPAWGLLTDREKYFFFLATGGLNSAQIAERMRVSRVAIRAYRRSVYLKLECTDMVNLTKVALAFGIAL